MHYLTAMSENYKFLVRHSLEVIAKMIGFAPYKLAKCFASLLTKADCFSKASTQTA